MILGGISWLDCIAFLVFLAPQLLIHVGFYETAKCGIKALPQIRTPFLPIPTFNPYLSNHALVFVIPYNLIQTRYFTPHSQRPAFVQQATLFQDLVIRFVRYGFGSIPASIGRVFFSKLVALPFFTFRRLRHGYLHSPIHWHQINHDGIKGLSAIWNEMEEPDVVVYYVHGGGFSMGSPYFYLEFLLAWLALLHDEGGFTNPALFALDYTLVPEATYPTQLEQTVAGYKYSLSLAKNNPNRVTVSGDSAGATLILSLLLHLASSKSTDLSDNLSLPALAIPISPWTTLISPLNQNTSSDFLDSTALELYGSQYIGTRASSSDPLVSPGACKDLSHWRRASPTKGWFFVYGAEEVFAPEARSLVKVLREAVGNKRVKVLEEGSWIHAWPVVKFFLGDGREERLSGLRAMVGFMRDRGAGEGIGSE